MNNKILPLLLGVLAASYSGLEDQQGAVALRHHDLSDYENFKNEHSNNKLIFDIDKSTISLSPRETRLVFARELIIDSPKVEFYKEVDGKKIYENKEDVYEKMEEFPMDSSKRELQKFISANHLDGIGVSSLSFKPGVIGFCVSDQNDVDNNYVAEPRYFDPGVSSLAILFREKPTEGLDKLGRPEMKNSKATRKLEKAKKPLFDATKLSVIWGSTDMKLTSPEVSEVKFAIANPGKIREPRKTDAAQLAKLFSDPTHKKIIFNEMKKK